MPGPVFKTGEGSGNRLLVGSIPMRSRQTPAAQRYGPAFSILTFSRLSVLSVEVTARSQVRDAATNALLSLLQARLGLAADTLDLDRVGTGEAHAVKDLRGRGRNRRRRRRPRPGNTSLRSRRDCP